MVPAPVLASHPLDLQAFPTSSEKEPAASGPPSVNIEAKVVGVSDDVIEAGGDPEGSLLIRGPPVGRQGGIEESYVDVRRLEEEDSWLVTGVRVRIQANGSFKLVK
jgi:long-chain acyl-CoA synthetase